MMPPLKRDRSMTPEQALAWLLLEGYEVRRESDTLYWTRPDMRDEVTIKLYRGNIMHTAMLYSYSEFVHDHLVPVDEWQRYAAEVVALMQNNEEE